MSKVLSHYKKLNMSDEAGLDPPVFQSTSKRLIDTRVYLVHEFTKSPPPHADTYNAYLSDMAQYPVVETDYEFKVTDGYPQLSEDDLEDVSVWWFRHSVSVQTGRLNIDCPKGHRPHTVVVEYWEGPSALTGDNEIVSKITVSFIPSNEVKLHAIPRDHWNLTQGTIPSLPSFYVDIPLTFDYVDIPPVFEPTNQGTYRYSVGDHMVSVRYSASPDGGVRVRMFLPAGMDLPDHVILAWSKDPTLGIPNHLLDESTKESTVSKESVVDKSTKVNKETKMNTQRTEHKVEQPTPTEGLVWTSELNLSGDHPEGTVEVAGQCRILDSDGLVMHQYRELEDRPVSAKVIRQYVGHVSASTYDYLELTTPKGWVPQNMWLHVITSEESSLTRMELYCDFRIEGSKKEDNTVESSDDPTVFDTLFHSCKFVTEAVSTEHSIELELPYEYHSHRIAMVSTLDPEDQPYVHPNALLSPSLTKRNEYLLGLVTAPGVTVSDVRHRLDQDGDLLIQVDVHRPQETEALSVNPDPDLSSDDSPKSSQTEDTADNQPTADPDLKHVFTPRQLMKEIYANRDHRIDEILQSVNNYFTYMVCEELSTDPDLKLVLESPVPEDLIHRLHHALIDAGYVVEIDNEKLYFTVELPPIE